MERTKQAVSGLWRRWAWIVCGLGQNVLGLALLFRALWPMASWALINGKTFSRREMFAAACAVAGILWLCQRALEDWNVGPARKTAKILGHAASAYGAGAAVLGVTGLPLRWRNGCAALAALCVLVGSVRAIRCTRRAHRAAPPSRPSWPQLRAALRGILSETLLLFMAGAALALNVECWRLVPAAGTGTKIDTAACEAKPRQNTEEAWAALSDDERRKLMAWDVEQLARRDDIVTPALYVCSLPEGVLGEYANGSIALSAELVHKGDMRSVLRTALHEYRHHFQLAACKKLAELEKPRYGGVREECRWSEGDLAQAAEWAADIKTRPGRESFAAYRDSPREEDADTYAEANLSRFYEAG